MGDQVMESMLNSSDEEIEELSKKIDILEAENQKLKAEIANQCKYTERAVSAYTDLLASIGKIMGVQ